MERATRPMHRWNPRGHAGSGCGRTHAGSTSLSSFDSILLQCPPSFPTSISRSGHLTFIMFCKFWGNTLHSLKCLKHLYSKVSTNTGERNEVEKGQCRSLWNCLDNPAFPREAFDSGAGGLGSGFHYAAEGGALQKEQRKDVKKNVLLSQDKLVKQDSA